MNITEVTQKTINHLKQTKATKIPELESCLNSNIDIKEKASCANQLGTIHTLTADDNSATLEAIKYFHIAYEFEPGNVTYIDNACMHTYLSVTKYSTQASFSDIEAGEILPTFTFLDKCKNYFFLSPEGTKTNNYIAAKTANNLGMFYYAKGQAKDNLENAKICFKIAYDVEPYQKVTYIGNLAAVHYKLGNIPEAINLYEECMQTKLTTSFPKAEKANCAGTLSLIYLETNSFEQALIFSKIANQLAPDNGYYMYNLASSYLATKQYDNAKYYFEKCSHAELTNHFIASIKNDCYKGLEMLGHLNNEF
jgi:hypothetical protein